MMVDTVRTLRLIGNIRIENDQKAVFFKGTILHGMITFTKALR
jgi:hypothetical protein